MDEISDEEFDSIARDVWARLLPVIPEELKSHFKNIHIVIESIPSTELLEELKGTDLAEDPSSLCGLHVGVPLPETSLVDPPLFPARVYLFRDAILDLADYDGSPEAIEDLREEIAITLLHEIGHYFGLEEDDLDRLGFG